LSATRSQRGNSTRYVSTYLKRTRRAPDCVVTVTRGEAEISIRFRNYEQAARWAQMECKSYRINQYDTVFEQSIQPAHLIQ
jgi:antibiotic biosynthesis monooxygenase (ABM) superfamily enzyme